LVESLGEPPGEQGQVMLRGRRISIAVERFHDIYRCHKKRLTRNYPLWLRGSLYVRKTDILRRSEYAPSGASEMPRPSKNSARLLSEPLVLFEHLQPFFVVLPCVPQG
jgi:hypothetical protein